MMGLVLPSGCVQDQFRFLYLRSNHGHQGRDGLAHFLPASGVFQVQDQIVLRRNLQYRTCLKLSGEICSDLH